MYIGVDYYPEQWPGEILDRDIERMIDMGVNIVRIGEFAWHIMEKAEGQFDFSFFDNVIAKLKEKGIKVVFGTPTATPPAWLIKKHPSILSKDEDLRARAFGGRRQYCFNSKIYYDYTRTIVEELVKHYKNEENIVAWQIDNEIGHEGSDMCYCEQCHENFKIFLREKYKNIEELNKAWGTVFWSQTYNDFNEIPLPLKTITYHNPSLILDYDRFRSKSINAYVNFQLGLIKRHKGENQQITTNIAGGFLDKHFDHEEAVKDMDFASFDNYPVWGGLKEPIPPCAIAGCHDFIRGLKEKNFWIVEELMGAQGHTVIGYLPRPNQAKMWSYQAFAHGCENMLYFRWRGAVFGTEQFCFGILDQDDKKGRKFNEVKSLIEEIKPFEEVIQSEIKSDVALIYDYENIWAWKIQPQSSAFDFNNEVMRLYAPFYSMNTHIDVIPSSKDFSKYKVLLVPVMMISDESVQKKIYDFTKNGGTVVLSFRAGIKDRNNNLYLGKTLPCAFAELAGIEIHEIESLQGGQFVEIEGLGEYKGIKGNSEVWRDIIDCTTAKSLFEYTDTFYKGKSCITLNKYGNGNVYYIGSGVDVNIVYLLAKEIVQNNDLDYIETPLGVEAYSRQINDKKYLFIMNHTEENKKFRDINLNPYESMIIEKK
jgi:beta-galactosidase